MLQKKLNAQMTAEKNVGPTNSSQNLLPGSNVILNHKSDIQKTKLIQEKLSPKKISIDISTKTLTLEKQNFTEKTAIIDKSINLANVLKHQASQNNSIELSSALLNPQLLTKSSELSVSIAKSPVAKHKQISKANITITPIIQAFNEIDKNSKATSFPQEKGFSITNKQPLKALHSPTKTKISQPTTILEVNTNAKSIAPIVETILKQAKIAHPIPSNTALTKDKKLSPRNKEVIITPVVTKNMSVSKSITHNLQLPLTSTPINTNHFGKSKEQFENTFNNQVQITETLNDSSSSMIAKSPASAVNDFTPIRKSRRLLKKQCSNLEMETQMNTSILSSNNLLNASHKNSTDHLQIVNEEISNKIPNSNVIQMDSRKRKTLNYIYTNNGNGTDVSKHILKMKKRKLNRKIGLNLKLKPITFSNKKSVFIKKIKPGYNVNESDLENKMLYSSTATYKRTYPMVDVSSKNSIKQSIPILSPKSDPLMKTVKIILTKVDSPEFFESTKSPMNTFQSEQLPPISSAVNLRKISPVKMISVPISSSTPIPEKNIAISSKVLNTPISHNSDNILNFSQVSLSSQNSKSVASESTFQNNETKSGDSVQVKNLSSHDFLENESISNPLKNTTQHESKRGRPKKAVKHIEEVIRELKAKPVFKSKKGRKTKVLPLTKVIKEVNTENVGKLEETEITSAVLILQPRMSSLNKVNIPSHLKNLPTVTLPENAFKNGYVIMKFPKRNSEKCFNKIPVIFSVSSEDAMQPPTKNPLNIDPDVTESTNENFISSPKHLEASEDNEEKQIHNSSLLTGVRKSPRKRTINNSDESIKDNHLIHSLNRSSSPKKQTKKDFANFISVVSIETPATKDSEENICEDEMTKNTNVNVPKSIVLFKPNIINSPSFIDECSEKIKPNVISTSVNQQPTVQSKNYIKNSDVITHYKKNISPQIIRDDSLSSNLIQTSCQSLLQSERDIIQNPTLSVHSGTSDIEQDNTLKTSPVKNNTSGIKSISRKKKGRKRKSATVKTSKSRYNQRRNLKNVPKKRGRKPKNFNIKSTESETSLLNEQKSSLVTRSLRGRKRLVKKYVKFNFSNLNSENVSPKKTLNSSKQFNDVNFSENKNTKELGGSTCTNLKNNSKDSIKLKVPVHPNGPNGEVKYVTFILGNNELNALNLKPFTQQSIKKTDISSKPQQFTPISINKQIPSTSNKQTLPVFSKNQVASISPKSQTSFKVLVSDKKRTTVISPNKQVRPVSPPKIFAPVPSKKQTVSTTGEQSSYPNKQTPRKKSSTSIPVNMQKEINMQLADAYRYIKDTSLVRSSSSSFANIREDF